MTSEELFHLKELFAKRTILEAKLELKKDGTPKKGMPRRKAYQTNEINN